MTNTFEPKIYIACLAAYNAGYLHGQWVDANQPVEALLEAVREVLNTSPIEDSEEWAIHDFEDFGGYELRESSSLEEVSQVADFLIDNGEIAAVLLGYFQNLDEAAQLLEEYCGIYENVRDFAEEIVQECYEIPDYLQMYIDYDAFGRDLFISDYLAITSDRGGDIYVFRAI